MTSLAIALPFPYQSQGVPRARTLRGDWPMDDAEAVAAARANDADAWRTLVERHEGAVAAVVIGMLGAGDDADDVGQETFIRCYRALGSFRGEASLRTWLQRIAMNLSLNALKRRKRGLQRFLPFADDDTAAPPQLQVDAVAAHDAQQTIDVVRSSIAQLPELQRAVVVLRMIEGYSTRETATMLNIAEGTVLSRLSRALDKLRTILGPLMHQDLPARNHAGSQ